MTDTNKGKFIALVVQPSDNSLCLSLIFFIGRISIMSLQRLAED